MAEIVEPQPQQHICDWAAGSGGLLLQCRNYVERHFGKKEAERVFLYMQENNPSTANISRINMFLHGARGFRQAPVIDSLRAPYFREGQTRRLRQFDRVVMNPPFSLEDWGYDDFIGGDPYDRFSFGMPPRDNGDCAWMQQVVRSLKPTGRAIVVMSQGVLFRGAREQTEEEDGRTQKADSEYVIREGFIKSDLIECVIVLPSKLFYGSPLPNYRKTSRSRLHRSPSGSRSQPRSEDSRLHFASPRLPRVAMGRRRDKVAERRAMASGQTASGGMRSCFPPCRGGAGHP